MHRLAGPMPPNWRVGGKKGLYKLEIGSEIDLVTWQYDVATECSGMPARRRRRFLECLQCNHCNSVITVML